MDRRKFTFGLVGLFAAPAIIKATSLMSIKPQPTGKWELFGDYFPYDIPYPTKLAWNGEKIPIPGYVKSNTGVWVKPHGLIYVNDTHEWAMAR
jgi:hypothetical protein